MFVGLGLIAAVRQAFERDSWTNAGVDGIEIDEASASIVISVMRELDLPEGIENVERGAIVRGHPISTKDAIVRNRHLRSVRFDRIKRQVVTLCIADGQGYRLGFESDDLTRIRGR